MRLLQLYLQNFRNISEASLAFPPGPQVLSGRNAQGKTSLLEAIYFLATATSPRTHTNRELIRKGTPSAFIRLEFESGDAIHTIAAGFDEKERRFRIDDTPLKRISDLYGHLRAVFFAPEDLEFLSGGPSYRRRILDLGMCQRYPAMVRVLLDYRKTLKQRNAVLRTADTTSTSKHLVRAWDQELSRLGAKVIRTRATYSLQLLEQTQGHYAEITQLDETLAGSYRASGTRQTWMTPEEVPNEEEIHTGFAQHLEANLERDLTQHQTLSGPHRDDLYLEVAGSSAERYASQGQRRSIVLALKLAERDLLTNPADPPLLLVDDVTHEMDLGRCRRFLEKVTQGGQALLTFTEPEAHRGLLDNAARWQVEEGIWTRQS